MSDNGFYTKNGVLFCRALAELPFIAHGFSTRDGGVSVLGYTKSLNLAYCRGDDDATVNENRRRFAANAGFDPGGLVCAEQIHSTSVVYADGTKKRFSGADGFVTDVPGVFAAVKTADCQPILFADPENRIVGVCHAGWRGTVGHIAAVTVEKMTGLGAKRENIVAAAGPCIGKCCFEVKEDFVAAVEKADASLLGFIVRRGGAYFADMNGMNLKIMKDCGLSEENIFVCGECTCCSPDKYYSHRRQKGVRGTMMSVIGIKKETSSLL
ncbi:MAG: peptidoglycan editing factor PgeF [Clostridia bacterium]|nr:peptidoglycan editing factor PgeF [Clostridia bacterium]